MVSWMHLLRTLRAASAHARSTHMSQRALVVSARCLRHVFAWRRLAVACDACHGPNLIRDGQLRAKGNCQEPRMILFSKRRSKAYPRPVLKVGDHVLSGSQQCWPAWAAFGLHFNGRCTCWSFRALDK